MSRTAITLKFKMHNTCAKVSMSQIAESGLHKGHGMESSDSDDSLTEFIFVSKLRDDGFNFSSRLNFDLIFISRNLC